MQALTGTCETRKIGQQHDSDPSYYSQALRVITACAVHCNQQVSKPPFPRCEQLIYLQLNSEFSPNHMVSRKQQYIFPYLCRHHNYE